MKVIDFLPQSYREARRRYAVRVRRLWLGGLTVAVLGLWLGVDAWRIHQVKGQLDALVCQNQTVQAGLEHIAGLHAERALLLDRYKLLQELQPSFSTAAALLHIAELLPPNVTLRRVQLSCDPTESGEPAVLPGKERPLTSTPRVVLVGIAVSQIDIAVLVGQMSGCRDFANVRLDYSKAAELEGRQVQEFRLTLDVLAGAAATQAATGV